MALEHFTAILAHELLKDPRHLAGADEDAADLWRWHACEEIEHKGVAYDTWLHATRHWPRSKRWKVKAKVMLYVTRNFVVDRTAGALELMRQDGVTGLNAWSKLLWYLWIRPGMFRKIGVAWFKFFLPGFHPWNEDDRDLLRAVRGERRRDCGARPAQEGPQRGLGGQRFVLLRSHPTNVRRSMRACASVPRAQLSRGAVIPSGSNPSFSSTRPEAGLSRKCEPSSRVKPRVRAISISAVAASVA